jgi:hypothetical protein
MAQLQASTVDGTITSLRTDNITTTSKNLQLEDRDKIVLCNNTSPITITVAPDSTVNFPIGSIVYVNSNGSASVTLAAGSGVTLTRSGTLFSGEELYVRKRSANSWIVVNQARRSGVK